MRMKECQPINPPSLARCSYRPAQRANLRSPAALSLAAALGDVIDRLLNGRDLLCVFIRNFGFEFLFKRHHELNGVERVGAEIVDEGSVTGDFFLFHPQLLGDDGFNLLFNTAHWCTSPL